MQLPESGLTRTQLDRLLRWLDPDPDVAAGRHETLRAKLGKFFEWRGASDPPAHVDATLDRVARKLAEGEEIRTSEPAVFAYGVARNVLREGLRSAQRTVPLSEAPEPAAPASTPAEALVDADTAAQRERHAGCLDRCLAGLDPGERAVLLRYYDGDGRARIANRVTLAAGLGVAPNALRIRVYRQRRLLEGCIDDCLKRIGAWRHPEVDGP
jgi:DNA-directed RNA polymerase specialized sigma24 family protein